MPRSRLGALALLLCSTAQAQLPAGFHDLSPLPEPDPALLLEDWLVTARTPEAGVYRHGSKLVMDNGWLRRTWRLVSSEDGCSIGCVGLDDLSEDRAILRAVQPEARLVLDGEELDIGGLTGQPNRAYLDPRWTTELGAPAGGPQLIGIATGPIDPRMAWARVRHHAPDLAWPPAGVQLTLRFRSEAPAVEIDVHYALYEGLPAYSKWLEVKNTGEIAVTIDRFASEILSVVEHSSWVEERGVPQPTPDLHVETDYAFGGMSAENANRLAVHWKTDPDYPTQVNYQRQTPCLLEVGPTVGPAQTIAPGESWTSFRTFVLTTTGDRERRSLARRRLMRTIAPWVTENPLMMHVRWSDSESVRAAIDQCAEVGFEMVILTFGSGFDLEDDSEANWGRMAELAAYASSKGVELGGYSLLSSRRVKPDTDNCIHPETGAPGGNFHGFAPALASAWGQAYFDKLYRFFSTSGFTLLEHDGSYPGDLDASARPPLQKGVHDSRWVQWRQIAGFYAWCRGQGIYLNVPDHYYLSGSNKCGMGYRETNWSLPREQQLIHARQNIFDGTWEKTPSMGWMFVPLTEYHGGGAAATIEPLDEHAEHYARALSGHLAFGVQACYRGPRLFDSGRTKSLVRDQVAWFKTHRRILESDVIHGRRADGRDLDWMLHVDPRGETKAMLVVFNPLDTERSRALRIDLHYAGLRNSARVAGADGQGKTIELRGTRAALDVRVPARSMAWYAFR